MPLEFVDLGDTPNLKKNRKSIVNRPPLNFSCYSRQIFMTSLMYGIQSIIEKYHLYFIYNLLADTAHMYHIYSAVK
jgi:hypothetical protein